MPGSVNVNEGSYRRTWPNRASAAADSAQNSLPHALPGQDEVDPSESYTVESASFDPHRALTSIADLLLPKPPAESASTPAGNLRRTSAQSAPTRSQQPDFGPCLYFGPAGQRCDRRALEGGFCSRHQPADLAGATRSISIPQVTKRTLGAAGILAVLWPILADLIREIIRLLR